MSETTFRMLQEKQESLKLDPRPLKSKAKKNTYGRGWHGEDDGKGTIEEINKTIPAALSSIENGGALQSLFVR